MGTTSVTVPLAAGKAERTGIHAFIQEFHSRHRQLYGFALSRLPGGLGAPEQAIFNQRKVFFEELRQGGLNGFVPCNIYDRSRLAPGSCIAGPAILEGMDSTVIINPAWAGQIDDYGNCIMAPV